MRIQKRQVMLGDVNGRQHIHVLKRLRDQVMNNLGNKVGATLGTNG